MKCNAQNEEKLAMQPVNTSYNSLLKQRNKELNFRSYFSTNKAKARDFF